MKSLPAEFRKIVVQTLSTSFRNSTAIITVPMPEELKPQSVAIRTVAAGVNASDVNFTAGVYRPGLQPPFDCGFESLGEVVAVGPLVTDLAVGDAVVSMSSAAFAEYQFLPSRIVTKVPSLDLRYLPLQLSGCTAAIALGELVQPKAGETALVTAAAGGTGQFAVQLLARAGCRVVGTCSTLEKAEFLRSIGCHRPVVYTEESLSHVLNKEFPTGVNIVYESVGGRLLDAALRHVALKGRIVTIGSISGYQDGSSFNAHPHADVNIPTLLLQKSASLRGFFLPHYAKLMPKYLAELSALCDKKEIIPGLDKRTFKGLEEVADAVEYLHSGANIGKVVVQIP